MLRIGAKTDAKIPARAPATLGRRPKERILVDYLYVDKYLAVEAHFGVDDQTGNRQPFSIVPKDLVGSTMVDFIAHTPK